MKESKNKHVLDSYAILTYLKEEPGWQKVRSVLWEAFKNKNTVFLNCVNLGEVYYVVYREYGARLADQAVSMIKLWPVKLVNVSEELAIIAGRMKAENKISYADAYVIATAISKKAIILTGDPEFKSVEELVNISWLPRNR